MQGEAQHEAEHTAEPCTPMHVGTDACKEIKRPLSFQSSCLRWEECALMILHIAATWIASLEAYIPSNRTRAKIFAGKTAVKCAAPGRLQGCTEGPAELLVWLTHP